MTATQFTPAGPLALPRMVCPSQVDIGNVVEFDHEPLPVVIASTYLHDTHRVFWYVAEGRKSNGAPVFEGVGVHDVGEPIKLLRLAAKDVTL
jgi:hypothetical protein